MNDIYVIEKLCTYTLKNDNAHHYEPIGYVVSVEEANRICNVVFVNRPDRPRPLRHVFEFSEGCVPLYRSFKLQRTTELAFPRKRDVYPKDSIVSINHGEW